MVWVGVISKKLKRTLWKPGFLLKVVDCCEQGFILIEIDGRLVLEFYWVRYPVHLKIRTGSWSMSHLEFGCWPYSGSASFFCSTIKSWLWFWIDLDGGKNKIRGGTPCKILVAHFSWWNWIWFWGDLGGNVGCSLQLVKLIEYKQISVGEPLTELQLLSSLGLHEEAKNG